MEPSTTSFRIIDNPDCLECGAPLDPGRKLRCNRCIAAAESAIREAGTDVVRPSDVAKARER